MTQPRHNLLPFGLIARPKFNRRSFRRCPDLDRSAPAYCAAHMLDDVCRTTDPAVQSKPAPQNSAVHDAPMLTESASRRDI